MFVERLRLRLRKNKSKRAMLHSKVPLLYFLVKVRASDERAPMLEFFLDQLLAGKHKLHENSCRRLVAAFPIPITTTKPLRNSSLSCC